MKVKGLILILACWFTLAPGLSSAQVTVKLGQDNDWYQGHQGNWQRQGSAWQWQSTHGDDSYQGRPGAWYQGEKDWQYYDNDGDQYRNGSHGWQWYDRYGHYHQSYEHGPRNG